MADLKKLVNSGYIDGSELSGLNITSSTGAFTTLSASTSLTTPLITRAGTLALSATGANRITASTNGLERMRIDSAGNVGIGETDPKYGRRLHVKLQDSGNAAGIMNLHNEASETGTGVGLTFLIGTGSFPVGAAGITAQSTNGIIDSDLQFSVRGGAALTERMRITSAGNVGIGTSSPFERLTVLGSISATGDFRSGISSSGGDAKFGQTDRAFMQIDRVGASSGGFVSFHTTPTTVGGLAERLRIDSAGNVGIGTGSFSPPGKLTVRRDGGSALTLQSVQTGVGALLNIDFQNLFSSGTDGSGVARIGAFTEGSVAGGRLFFSTSPNANSPIQRMGISSQGTIQFNAYGAGTLSTNTSGVISASDGRYKTKTRSIESGLDAIAALQPTYFKWDEDSPFASENEELGFIAQEVAAAIPEASPGEDEEGKFRNYHDRAIIAMLVKGMQEQQAIIEELKARLDAANL